MELALFRLLSDESKSTFEKLDNEFADIANVNLGEGRLQPAEDNPEVRWSLSQWSQLRLSQILPTDPNADIPLNASQQPVEMANLQNMFPAFYASLPDNLNN